MYKYQKETIEYLESVVGKLEKLTEDRMKINIGSGRIWFCSTNGDWFNLEGELYLRINYEDHYMIEDSLFEEKSFDNLSEDDKRSVLW